MSCGAEPQSKEVCRVIQAQVRIRVKMTEESLLMPGDVVGPMVGKLNYIIISQTRRGSLHHTDRKRPSQDEQDKRRVGIERVKTSKSVQKVALCLHDTRKLIL